MLQFFEEDIIIDDDSNNDDVNVSEANDSTQTVTDADDISQCGGLDFPDYFYDDSGAIPGNAFYGN